MYKNIIKEQNNHLQTLITKIKYKVFNWWAQDSGGVIKLYVDIEIQI